MATLMVGTPLRHLCRRGEGAEARRWRFRRPTDSRPFPCPPLGRLLHRKKDIGHLLVLRGIWDPLHVVEKERNWEGVCPKLFLNARENDFGFSKPASRAMSMTRRRRPNANFRARALHHYPNCCRQLAWSRGAVDAYHIPRSRPRHPTARRVDHPPRTPPSQTGPPAPPGSPAAPPVRGRSRPARQAGRGWL